MVIVTAGHGHLLGLWRLRLWFVYTVLCLCVRDLVDSFISKYIPFSTPLHPLSPKATKLGYIVGGIVAFIIFFKVRTLKVIILGGKLYDR
jgi:hypothetical protein